ncbi:hypothetical protein GH714_034780 [Hevea brasiliensis]|uniref:GST N-terminal domain-containing protein n=1 Tax=Hevea brasiliensis TaxID=3981 RepID=A0A6A6L736_HEVBR|nr:hypothetical protein GH714_034780 [Hevea brasiliensis]
MATGSWKEVLSPALTTSEPPPIFDGTTRLYISYSCPYAQRVWITRNCKGLQDKIKLVPIDLQNRPTWYKEKVYPPNKVPSMEHDNEVKGESLDLVKYIDSNFDGPSLFPDVDIVYAPFIERFQPALLDVRKYDITEGRPNLAAWIEEMNKIEAYDQTRRDPKEMLKPARNAFWLISEVCCCHESDSLRSEFLFKSS